MSGEISASCRVLGVLHWYISPCHRIELRHDIHS
jgi:hypothetical protein